MAPTRRFRRQPPRDHTYAVRHIQLGTRGANTVQIISGLHEGDQVVSRGGLTLKSMLANNS